VSEAAGLSPEPAALGTFERERGRMFGVAYRMLGSVREAEDVLQDAYLRWHGVDHARVENPSAYLVRLVTRLCIDTLRAVHHRRTEYVGVWLPEPLVAEPDPGPTGDPAGMHELADELSLAFLFMLERLTPVERAVFLLRESFDFSYRQIAEIVGKTEENCRQIERRARKRLAEGGRPVSADPEEHDRLLTRFLLATREGDVEGLLHVLADDVVAYSDGGGKVPSALRPVTGADRVARFMVGLVSKATRADFRLATINGRTGVVNYVDGRLHSVAAIHVEDGRIRSLFLVTNPDKLGTAGPDHATSPAGSHAMAIRSTGEEVSMMQLALDAQEASVLAGALRSYLSDLRSEVVATDSFDYREALKQQESTLTRIMEDLERFGGGVAQGGVESEAPR